MSPTLRQLSFLVALADTGSFVTAARAASVTQPTLSSGIKELELTLGVQLVERHRTGAELTQAGAEATRRAREILQAVGSLADAARGAAEPLAGQFRLGVIPTIAPFLLPDVLPAIEQAYPKLKLLLREDLTDRLLDRLRDHTLDAAIIALPWESPGIEMLGLFADEFLFVGPPGHRFAEREAIAIDEIEDEEMLLLEEGHCLRNHALGVCNAAKPGHEEVRATSLLTLVQMVGGGLGASLVPGLAVGSGLVSERLVLKPFDPPVVGREVGMAWRSGSARQAEVKALGELIKQSR